MSDSSSARLGEPPQKEEIYRKALERIADPESGDFCGCEHDDENCCAVVGHHCPECIAHAALTVGGEPPQKWPEGTVRQDTTGSMKLDRFLDSVKRLERVSKGLPPEKLEAAGVPSQPQTADAERVQASLNPDPMGMPPCVCGHVAGNHRWGSGSCWGVVGDKPCMCVKFSPELAAGVASPPPQKEGTQMNPYDVEDDWSKIDADAKASREPVVKLMVHCEGCGGFAHFGLDAFDGMESGTILPPCEECGQRMTVLLCKDGEYQRYLSAPSPPPPGWQPSGAERIAAERKRQVEVEGWAPEHDDRHRSHELLAAAQCYIRHAIHPGIPTPRPRHLWPWDMSWWKPSQNPIRNLEKAGALIAAEIDRLQRESSVIPLPPEAP